MEECLGLERHCPACGSAAGQEHGQKDGFKVFTCRKCRTLYVSAGPGGTCAQDYDSYYNPENLSVPAFIHKRLDQIVARFAPYRRQGRLLDVGFGAGVVLQAATRAGWIAEGVEVSETAVRYVESLGYKAFCGELAAAQYPADYFDVVTASEVLEHIPYPRDLITEIARILRPGGLFWATTPHGRGISARLLGLRWSVVSPPEHLQLFSLSGIKTLLTSAGFRKIRVLAQGVNPFEILHALRSRHGAGARKENNTGENSGNNARADCFDRVQSSCHLNARLIESPYRRMLKDAINEVLSTSRLGDSVKIWAEK